MFKKNLVRDLSTFKEQFHGRVRFVDAAVHDFIHLRDKDCTLIHCAMLRFEVSWLNEDAWSVKAVLEEFLKLGPFKLPFFRLFSPLIAIKVAIWENSIDSINDELIVKVSTVGLF